ncbi:MAG: DUF4251 domain-containing protein [Bacteroidia bacterium]|nr:DUF4251 domain-containing protein [Bacteroidia bacterium]NNK72012.1 DUF4251 domain-containing protein [Flavobacteriaceae bacterium]
MKKLLLSLVLMTFVGVLSFGQSREERKKIKEEEAEAYYQEAKQLLGSGNYSFRAEWMYPLGQIRANVLSRPAFLRVSDDYAEAFFPYRGIVRGAGSAHGGGGIEFNDSVRDYEASFDDENREIYISFKISGKEDHYQVDINLFRKTYVKVTISSDKRDSIFYEGQLFEFER